MLTLEALKAMSPAEQAKLVAEFNAAKAAKTGPLTCKVSEKGALSIYGMGRFPITLYLSQWERLAQNFDAIGKFVEANKDKFAVKS